MDIVNNKTVFLSLAKKYIKREGIDKLLAWLERSDFFVCPASTQYNLPVEGGLCMHALNVTDSLIQKYLGKSFTNLTEEDVQKDLGNEMTVESLFIVGLFSSINKVNCYIKDTKNVKNKETGKWEAQEYWKWDEAFIYSGRGSKSVYILQQYMRLYVEEAQAIAFFLAGEDSPFSNVLDTTYRKVYEKSSLSLFLHLAEMEATYFTDNQSIDT